MENILRVKPLQWEMLPSGNVQANGIAYVYTIRLTPGGCVLTITGNKMHDDVPLETTQVAKGVANRHNAEQVLALLKQGDGENNA